MHASAHPGVPSMKGEAAADPHGLAAIMENESSGGKNLNHAVVEHGPNKGHRAGGGYAVMPITFKDVVDKHPDLKSKYGHVGQKSPDEITSHLNSDQGMAKDVATRHYNNLHRAFNGDHVKVAHAWLHGQTGTKNTPEEKIVSHPYVKDYLKNYAKASARGAKPAAQVASLAPPDDEPRVAVAGSGGTALAFSKSDDDFGGAEDDEFEKAEDRYVEDMSAHKGKSVFVYYNLHKKVWSVKHKGRVIAHTRNVTLDNARFKVSEAGRQRVIAEKKKNVHAGVTGTIGDHHPNPDVSTGHSKVSYNPYHAGHFYETKQGPEGKSVPGEPIHEAHRAHMLVHQKQGPAGAVNIPSVHAKKYGPDNPKFGGRSMVDVGRGGVSAGSPEMLDKADILKAKIDDVRAEKVRVGKPKWFPPRADGSLQVTPESIERDIRHMKESDRANRHQRSGPENQVTGHPDLHGNIEVTQPRFAPAEPFTPVDPLLRPIGARKEQKRTSPYRSGGRGLPGGRSMEDVGRGGVPAGSREMLGKAQELEKAKIDEHRANKVREWAKETGASKESSEAVIAADKSRQRDNRQLRTFPGGERVQGDPSRHSSAAIFHPERPVDPLRLRQPGRHMLTPRPKLTGGRDMTDVGRGGVPASSPEMLDDVKKAKADDIRWPQKSKGRDSTDPVVRSDIENVRFDRSVRRDRRTFDSVDPVERNAEHRAQHGTSRHLESRRLTLLRRQPIIPKMGDSIKDKQDRGSIPEMNKADLMKMAIADLRAGELKHSDETHDHHNYNHLLSDGQRKAGYSLTVLQRKPNRAVMGGPYAVKAYIHHGMGPKRAKVGHVVGEVHDTGQGLPNSSYSITPHSHINEEHRGNGLATAAYEALYAHAKHKMKVTSVDGGDHSAAAGRVHESLARKHGLKYKSKVNNHVSESVDERGPYRYALKSMEPMEKMAIRDIKPGKPNKARDREQAPAEWDHESIPAKHYDYSHVLSPAHRKAGYSMEVSTHEDGYGDHSVYSTIHHKGKLAGSLRSEHGESKGKGELWVHDAQINKEHRGKGLGTAAYEATYAHAKHTAKLKSVHGGIHSTSASFVHQSLARKHGLGYKVEKNPFTAANSHPNLAPHKKKGDYDQHHPPYSYALKSEEPTMSKAGPTKTANKEKKNAFVSEKGWGEGADKIASGRNVVTSQHRDRMTHQPIGSYPYGTGSRFQGSNYMEPASKGHDFKRGTGREPDTCDDCGVHRHDHYKVKRGRDMTDVGRGGVPAGSPEMLDPIEKSGVKRHDSAVKKVRAVLSDDLRRKEYKGSPNAMRGHCYVAAEATYHLLGGKDAGWKPMHVRHEGEPHWFLQHEKHGVVDPTADQFKRPVPYHKGRGIGFLTKQPSKRAQTVLDAVNET